MHSSLSLFAAKQAQPTLPPLPAWLADEANLADEAVLAGLSEARPDERIAQIRLAFAERTAWLEKQIEQAQEQIGELNLTIEAARARLTTMETGTQPLNQNYLSEAGQRLLLGFGLTLIGSVGAFFGAEALAPTTGIGLVSSGIIGLAGVGAFLIRYSFDLRARLEQQRTNQLHHNEQTTKLTAEITDYQASKRQLIHDLYLAEAERDQYYAHRDRLIHLFESEFDLARSLRYSLKPDNALYV